MAERRLRDECPRLLGVLVLACVVLLAGCRPEPPPPRDITLVARGMAFVLEGAPGEPNPTIEMHPGERIRLVLRNEAPGLLHQVEIPEWRVEVDQIRVGQTAEVEFVVPNAPGAYEYRCRPHAGLMRGTVRVIPE